MAQHLNVTHMSGGTFGYEHYRLQELADEIAASRDAAISSGVPYAKETLEQFDKTEALLRAAAVYLERVDYLLAGDDGEVTFHRRLLEAIELLPADAKSLAKK